MQRTTRERKCIPRQGLLHPPQHKIPKPPWLRVRLPSGEAYSRIKDLLHSKSLHTVCEEALCPNLAECWGNGTATFLILGDVCTRSCGFCAVKGGRPQTNAALSEEPLQLTAAVAAMRLTHVVITSVTRDDLPDGGAAVFAQTIDQIRRQIPECTVEVLIPDFQGDPSALQRVMASRPEILGHNLETVARLYPGVRPQAKYQRSLQVLQMAREQNPDILTKSGVMVGLGETWEELLQLMADLRNVGCDLLTVGQYLCPSAGHIPVFRYYSPEEFAALKQAARDEGFRWVESGPLVRSSYHAELPARALRVAK